MGLWVLTWTLLAAAAGGGLAAVAASLSRQEEADEPDLDRGYNVLAPIVDRSEP